MEMFLNVKELAMRKGLSFNSEPGTIQYVS